MAKETGKRIRPTFSLAEAQALRRLAGATARDLALAIPALDGNTQAAIAANSALEKLDAAIRGASGPIPRGRKAPAADLEHAEPEPEA